MQVVLSPSRVSPRNVCPVSGLTRQEEILNAVTHGLGLLGCIGGTVVLLVLAAQRGTGWQILGVSVFGGALVLLYGVSTSYHSAWSVRWKRVLQVVDHMSIFALIAGSYTPFALGPLRGPWGWSLLGVIWSLAMAGIVFKLIVGNRFAVLSTLAYILMGWLVVIAFGHLAAALDTPSLIMLALGGVAYTVGAGFYLWDERIRYFHPIFHVLVLVGSACHYWVVLEYVRNLA